MFSTNRSRLLISLFSIALAINVAGCSSSGSSDEESAGGEETFAEESSGDFEDGEEVAEGEEGTEEGAEEGTDVAESEEGAEGEEGSTDVAEGEDLESENLDGELADSEEAGMDDGGLDEGESTEVAATDDDELSLDDEEGLPDDVAGDEMAEPTAPIEEPATPPTDAPVFAEESTPPVSDPIADPVMEEPVAPRAYLPLLKVKAAAFDSGGTNLNRDELERVRRLQNLVISRLTRPPRDHWIHDDDVDADLRRSYFESFDPIELPHRTDDVWLRYRDEADVRRW